jgi:hypothetical protein
MSWLSDLVDQHSELETPLSFWRWSALAAISAILKDNIWLGRQIYNLYPNIYVMLHARSGLKKGPAVSMAKQMVQAVNNTEIISGRSSIQGILKEMGQAKSMPGGKIQSKSTIFICSSELTSSIVEDPTAIKLLTDLYDRNYNVAEWRSLLKMETFDIKAPTVTMLTATNEAMAEGFIDRIAVKGGYFARTFIIYEEQRNQINSLAYPLDEPIDYKASAGYLHELAKLRGAIEPFSSLEEKGIFKYKRIKRGRKKERDVFFSEVGLRYDNWYEGFIKDWDESLIEDTTGILGRFGDSVLKVAILISLAAEPKLEISLEALEEAITLCEKLVGNVRRATLGKSADNNDASNAVRKTLLIEELMRRDNHMITRAGLNKKYWMQGNANDWDECVASMEVAGVVKIESVGNNILFRMPDVVYEEYKRFMEGKMK